MDIFVVIVGCVESVIYFFLFVDLRVFFVWWWFVGIEIVMGVECFFCYIEWDWFVFYWDYVVVEFYVLEIWIILVEVCLVIVVDKCMWIDFVVGD